MTPTPPEAGAHNPHGGAAGNGIAPPAPTAGDGMDRAQPVPPVAAVPPVASAAVLDAGPIKDLSYRTYEGPIHTRAIRWWIVALATIRMTGARRIGYYIVAALGAMPYLFMGVMLWVLGRFTNNIGNGNNPFFDTTVGQKYASALFNGLNWQMFLLLIITLIVGAGSIASDNQSNALLVYLAKPITKADYLIGKWVGVFFLVFMACFVPSLVLYLFCFLSYLSDGFLKQEPWLFFRMIGACAVPAAVYASLMIGISAWSKSPAVAAAIKAALYIATGAVALVLFVVQIANHHGHGIEVIGSQRAINLHHAGENGIMMGLAQNIYGITFHVTTGARNGFQAVSIPPPTLWMMLLPVLGCIALGLWAAYWRIRAVEVVTG